MPEGNGAERAELEMGEITVNLSVGRSTCKEKESKWKYM